MFAGYWIFHELGLDVRLFYTFFDIKKFQQFLNFSNRWSNIHFSYNQDLVRFHILFLKFQMVSSAKDGMYC